MVKVLVVEDEASIREMIALHLRLAGMEAVEADSQNTTHRWQVHQLSCRDNAVCKKLLSGDRKSVV